MKLSRWQVILGGLLIALSFLLYGFQYALFRDGREIIFWFFQDIAFVPIEVLLVTVIVQRYMAAHEKRARLNKMNMVIGAFFNEAGTGLIEHSFPFIPEVAVLGKHLRVSGKWSRRQFEEAASALRRQDFEVDSRKGDLEALKRFLEEKRMFLLRLLENPNLLEHDTFTDLLWAVFHLADELDHRQYLHSLPPTDYDHLSGDLRRAFVLLLAEWLSYMRHLQGDYPYLFSLAVRINPFDPQATAVVG